MGRWSELRELTRQRVLTFMRQQEAVFWVFVFPMILAAVLGFAFKEGGAPASRVGIFGVSGEAGERLTASEGIELEEFETREAAEVALSGGHVDVLVLPGEAPLVRLDTARQEAELARLRVLVALQQVDESALPVELVTERGSRYVDFLLPGLLGMNLMGTGLWAIGFAIADMRQRKVLKRLLVSPMRRSSFLASLMLSRLVFLLLEVVFLTLFATFVLEVPLRSSLVEYGLLCLLGAVCFAGLGVLAASRVKTIEGVSGVLNFVMMPMWLGSGVFFSYERFPDVVQPFLRALPLTALNDSLRALMLDGAGLGSVLPELGILVAWTVASFLLALKLFRWK